MYTVDFNRDFQFTFSPIPEKIKPKLRSENKRRFTVSYTDLPKYIGKKRTEFILKKVAEMDGDKQRFKIQNKGVVDVYCK